LLFGAASDTIAGMGLAKAFACIVLFCAAGAAVADQPDAQLVKQAEDDVQFLRMLEGRIPSLTEAERIIEITHPAVVAAQGGADGMRRKFANQRQFALKISEKVLDTEVVGEPKYLKGSVHEFVIVTVKRKTSWLGRESSDERPYIGGRKWGEKNLVYVTYQAFIFAPLKAFFPDFPETNGPVPKDVLTDLNTLKARSSSRNQK
jgi:hypothetical protein